MQPPIHPNPYAPPEVPVNFTTHEPERYEFDAVVLESDVHRATRRLGRFFVGFCILSGAIFFSLLLILVSLRRPVNLPVVLYFSVSSLLLLFGLLRTTWLNIGPGAGRRRVRASPLLVGHIHGTISDSEIRVSTEKSTSTHPLKSCCYADIRGDSLVFAFDQRRLMLTVIPRRAFAAGCFERAVKLLMHYAAASKISPLDGVVDQRLLTGEFYPIDLPADGVPFSGSITSRDIMASPLRSQTKKAKLMLLGASAFVTLFPLAILVPLYDKLRMEIGILLIGFFQFLNLGIWRSYRKNLAWIKTPEQVLMRSRGVISHQALHASTPAGATVYRWDIFTEATIQAEQISLALPGKYGHRVLLCRSQFASDNDWSQAQAIIREQARHFPIVDQV